MYFVYIIYSEKTDQFYVGSSQNVEERVRRHNAGHSRSTKGKAPWKLVKSIALKTRSEAMQLENKIKGRGIKRYLYDHEQSG